MLTNYKDQSSQSILLNPKLKINDQRILPSHSILTIRSAKVRAKDDTLGILVQGILDGVKGSNNALVVRDLSILLWDIEVDSEK